MQNIQSPLLIQPSNRQRVVTSYVARGYLVSKPENLEPQTLLNLERGFLIWRTWEDLIWGRCLKRCVCLPQDLVLLFPHFLQTNNLDQVSGEPKQENIDPVLRGRRMYIPKL